MDQELSYISRASAWVSTNWPNLAGLVGAVLSLQFINGTAGQKAFMVFGGTAFSWYVSAYVASKMSMPLEVVALFLGLMGMSILSKAWSAVQAASLESLMGRIGTFFKGNGNGK